MPYLFAQDVGGLPAWLRELGLGGRTDVLAFGFFMVIALGIVAVAIVAIVLHHRREAMKHHERMAMIEAGMHPDFPSSANEVPLEQESVKRTVEYRPTA